MFWIIFDIYYFNQQVGFFIFYFFFGAYLSLLEKKVEGARHEAFDDRIINLKHALSASELSIILSLTGLKPFDISFTLFYFFFKEPTNFTATTNSIISISMNTSRLIASQYNSQYILLFRLKRKKIGPTGVEEQKIN